MKSVLVSISLVFIQLTTLAQAKDWEEKLNQTLSDFKNCMETDDKTVCQTYTAKGFRNIYAMNDFYNTTSKTDMSPSEILANISSSSRWTKLGQAFEPDVISKAHELCNSGKPVLIVFKGSTEADTHVSIMVPGDLHTSGSWGMKVPSVSAYFTHKPENSFVNKALSYAYSKSMMLQLEVYSRN